MLDLIVYDTEIVKCIPDRGGRKAHPDLDYCAGWDDYANMGISVLCAWDMREGMPRVFLGDNLVDFARLIEDRTVAGVTSSER